MSQTTTQPLGAPNSAGEETIICPSAWRFVPRRIRRLLFRMMRRGPLTVTSCQTFSISATMAVGAALLSAPAWAQAVVAPAPSINLTGIATTVIAGVFSILGVVLPLMIQSHMKDQAAALALGNAVKNSLGAIQQSATATVKAYNPDVKIPGISPDMAAGIQYVLDNAGVEADRLGITQDNIVSKISAQIGLANIVTNQATAASPTASPAPLDPLAKAAPAPVGV